MTAVLTKPRRKHAAPDLSEYRKRYPLTVANFGALGDREAWLDRLWEMDRRWQETVGQGAYAREAIVRGAPPAGLSIEGEFDIIYFGGRLGLLHAAVMSCRHKRRVMVFDAGEVCRAERAWNISQNDLRGLEAAALFTTEEIEAAVVNRYQSGFVKFYDAGSRVKTPPLFVDGVLDVSLDARQLLALAASRLEASETNSAVLSNLRFLRCYIRPDRVLVEVEDVRSKKRSLFGARLFVDASGADSSVARQLNGGRLMTHVCPTVGTIARGFTRGPAPDQVDFSVGEILVSNEDARDHRQLIWEGFAGSAARDEYATYLFFYDAVDSPADKSLLALFERYFETLPRYKHTGAQWRVLKPVFGHLPAFQRHALRGQTKRTAEDRVMLIGDAANWSSPLTVNGFGPHARVLRRLTHLTDLALEADLLDASSLSEISGGGGRIAQLASFAEFLRPTPKSAPAAVNETLNAVMAALHSLDVHVRRELFQDRMSLNALKRLLGRTAKLYPRIFQRVREHFGARGMLWWLAGLASAAFSERLKARSVPAEEAHTEDAVKEFARQLALYKREDGRGPMSAA